MDPKVILKKTARIIQENGWTQRCWKKGTALCLLSALEEACTQLGATFEDFLKTSQLIEKQIYKIVGRDVGMTIYNDTHCTSVEDVYSLLRLEEKKSNS